MNLIKQLDTCELRSDQMAVVWLGQAGFLFKSSGGSIVAVDPYLSHCGEKRKQFIRLSPILAEPESFEVDALLVTHKHFDHFDYDAIPVIAAHTRTQFYGPISCVREFQALGIEGKEMGLLQPGEPALRVAGDVWARAVFADHGEMEPDAVGFVLRIGNTEVYVTGDTAFRPQQMTGVRDTGPDLMIASVNGEFGNLNCESGAELAVYTGAKMVIPCHFWTFREHKGRPDLLEGALLAAGSSAQLQFLTAGEIYICEKTPEGDVKMNRR